MAPGPRCVESLDRVKGVTYRGPTCRSAATGPGGGDHPLSALLSYSVVGIVTGCIYALTAAGLVVTYTTSGIFNFAHGAIGMMAAFAYWDLSVNRDWPVPLALFTVVFVLAPLFGALLERVLMRRLDRASLDISLTVTVGLLVFLIGLATAVWNPTTARTLPRFFSGDSVRLASVNVTYHQIIVVLTAIAVAVALRVFLFSTRAGVATRAVVDDRELAALTGASPGRFSQLGWALGAMLAAIAGILLAPLVNLDINTLTLLVINGYAAAMLGRLRNLPLTFVGGVVIGLLEAYAVGYLPVGDALGQIKPIIPMVFLFLVLLVLPQDRLRGRSTGVRPPRVAGARESLVTGAAFVGVAVVAALVFGDGTLSTLTTGVSLGMVLLSLVLLTGYSGQVSLCQLTFAGIGAYAMAKVGGEGGAPVGLLAAIALAAAVGAVVALPALRLRGLYLALSTLAFAYCMDYVFFSNEKTFGSSLSLSVEPVYIPGVDLTGQQAYFVFVCVLFALAAIGVLWLRRSTIGRRLVAMGDSPAACATIGMSLPLTKLVVFALSAGLAGLGGALLGGQQGLVGPTDFTLLGSITLLLLAVVMGIRTVTGMLFAGIALAYGPVLQSNVDVLRDVVSLLVGLGAIGLGLNPNGVFGGHTPLQRRRERKAAQLARRLEAAEAEEALHGEVAGAAR